MCFNSQDNTVSRDKLNSIDLVQSSLNALILRAKRNMSLKDPDCWACLPLHPMSQSTHLRLQKLKNKNKHFVGNTLGLYQGPVHLPPGFAGKGLTTG